MGWQRRQDHDGLYIVHYRDDLIREDIKTLYAIGGLNPTECGLEMSESGTSDLHTLNTLSTSAPIISLSIGSHSTEYLLYH